MKKLNKTLQAQLKIAGVIKRLETMGKSQGIYASLRKADRKLGEAKVSYVHYTSENGRLTTSEGSMKLDTLADYLEGLVEVCAWAERQSYITQFDTLQAMIEMMESRSHFGAVKAAHLKDIIDGCSESDYVFLRVIMDVLVAGYNQDSITGNTRYTHEGLAVAILGKLKFGGASGANLVDEMIETFKANGTLQVDGQYLVYRKYHMIESIVNKVCDEEAGIKMLPIIGDSFTEHQQMIANGLANDENKVSILAGEAGTGKTYVIVESISAEVKAGRRVLVCSPTHKACKVLTEALKDAGISVNRLVGSRVCTIDAAQNTLDIDERSVDVMYVDEASMASTSHFAILNMIKAEKIILIGDPSQLPPVGAGAVFANLLSDPNTKVKKHALTIKMRAANEQVAALCDHARNSPYLPMTDVVPLVCSKTDRDYILECDDIYNGGYKTEQVKSLLKYVIDNRDSMFIANDNATVDALNVLLLYIRRYSEMRDEYNKRGCIRSVNALVKVFACTNQDAAMKHVPNVDLFEFDGAIVVWDGDSIKLDSDYKISRGCIGTIKGGKVEIEAQRYSKREIEPIIMRTVAKEVIEAATASKDRLRLNYVSTVHKSQGSTYDNVVYLVKETYCSVKEGQGGYGAGRPLAYVAVSRAKKSAKVLSLNGRNSVDLYTPIERETYLEALLSNVSDF